MSEYENTSPQSCAEVGLSCHQCIEHTAREVAQSCKGLRTKMVAQLFVQIYPAPACARMHARFAQAYRNASEETTRREVESETRTHAMVAVA